MYVTEILRNIKFQANEMLILLGYLIAHGGVFILMPAIYWDDWVLYNQETSEILSRFEMAGAAFGIYGHVHAFMQLLGPAGYKLLTFFMFFGSIILCYKILLRQEWISQKSCYLIALLFAVLPFNFARIMEISLPYSLSNFLFFSGWYLLFRSKIIAILLFILAFSVPSFLVFYLLPVAEMLRRDVFLHTFSWKSDSLKKIIAWVVKNVVIVTLPIAYFFIKNLYYSPSGF